MADNAQLEHVKHASTEAPVEEIIKRRWSPRAFAETPVTEEQLKTIFTAGAWAASSFNEQPWRFILGRKGDPAWQHIFNALTEPNQTWAGSAPILYASFAKKHFSHNNAPNRVAVHDVGAASQNIALQATPLGLHAHGMAGFDAAKLSVTLDMPDDFEPVAVWALGHLGDPETLANNYRAMETAPRTRKHLNEFVFSTWGQPAL